MYTKCKRKRVVLNISDKLKIIKRLKNGESASKLANEFKVGNSTITDIKKNEDKLTTFVGDNGEGCRRKSMKSPTDVKLEEAVYTWFMQRRSLGEALSGPLICEKALELNHILGGNSNFKATTGWLMRFKERHGIRHLKMQGENRPTDLSAADSFKEKLSNLIDSFDPDLVYNTEETVLNWKALPSKAVGTNVNKDHVRIMVCANSTGTHKLPVMMVGSWDKPSCFKHVNMNAFPVKYVAQSKNQMDISTFKQWYLFFVQAVKCFHLQTGKKGKVLLLTHDAPSQRSNETLEDQDEDFTVAFLPSFLKRPMDQGVIATLKKNYRKRLLLRLLIDDDKDGSIKQVYKDLDLKECGYMLAEAWQEVDTCNLRRCWSNVFLHCKGILSQQGEKEISLLPLVREVVRLNECNEADVDKWLYIDNEYSGTAEESEETVKGKLGGNKEVEESSFASYPSNSEAVKGLDVGLRWFEKQQEADPVLLMSLKRIRDFAALKRASVLRKKVITDIFP